MVTEMKTTAVQTFVILSLLLGISIGAQVGCNDEAANNTTGEPGDAKAPAPADATFRPTETKNWHIFRNTQEMQGVSYTDLGDISKLEKLWAFETGDRVWSTAAVVDGVVYIGSSDSKVYAMDFQTGEKKWEYEVEFDVEGPILVVDNKVIATSLDGYAYCLKAADGERLWKFETDGDIIGGANYVRHENAGLRILVGSKDYNLYCIDAETGKKVWHYEATNFINATPTVWKNYAMFGGCDAIMHMVNSRTGRADATINTQGYVAKAGAVYKDHLYVGNYVGELLCIDLKEGELKWAFAGDRGEPMFTAPAVADGKAVIGCRDGRLYCVDVTGDCPEKLWDFRTRNEINSSPVICNGKVIFGSDDGRLYILNLADGKELWQYEMGQPIYSSPAVVDGKIIIGCDDGFVYAFGVKKR